MAKLKLDLHDIYNRGAAIDQALERVIREAVDKKIREVEIIPGKGRFLSDQGRCRTSARMSLAIRPSKRSKVTSGARSSRASCR
ncbi:Smr/MutS family protein [Wenzhouxiangella sp. XN79A]|nr:Smr/MutS family protein [Wenzhouxiangella sp. XN79A]